MSLPVTSETTEFGPYTVCRFGQLVFVLDEDGRLVTVDSIGTQTVHDNISSVGNELRKRNR